MPQKVFRALRADHAALLTSSVPTAVGVECGGSRLPSEVSLPDSGCGAAREATLLEFRKARGEHVHAWLRFCQSVVAGLGARSVLSSSCWRGGCRLVAAAEGAAVWLALLPGLSGPRSFSPAGVWLRPEGSSSCMHSGGREVA